MGEVIGFLSGKGGTGKSAICAGVAQGLASRGHRVLCIDLNAGLPGLDLALGLGELPCLTFADVCGGGYSLEQATVHPVFENISFLSAPVEQCPLTGLDGLLAQAKEEFAFVLLDGPAGIGENFSQIAGLCDRVALVAGYDPDAVRCAARVGDLLELNGCRNVRMIINRVNLQAFKVLKINADDLMDRAGLPLLGVVPEDGYVLLAAANGIPLYKQTSRGATAACDRIARRILGQSVPVKV